MQIIFISPARLRMENCIPVDKELKKGSGVFIYLDTKNECLKEPAEGVYKVWCSYKGDITVWQGNKGEMGE